MLTAIENRRKRILEQRALEHKLGMPYHCELCDVFCSSKVVWESHLNGRKHRHKAFMAGLYESDSDSSDSEDLDSFLEKWYESMNFEDISN